MAFPVDVIDKVKDYFPTGSRVICNPPIMNTDEDWVVLLHHTNAFTDFKKYMRDNGWETCGQDYALDPFGVRNRNRFVAFRKGELNLIVTDSPVVFDRYKIATKIATRLNLFNKEDRIALFQIIRDYEFETRHQLHNW